MGFFLAHTRGAVRVVNGPWRGAPSLRVRVQGLRDHLNRNTAIVTQVGLSQQGNFQFVHTVNDRIFVYVFGDRISELRVSGVAFAAPCATPGENGLDAILRGYERHKLSAAGRPVIVALGSFRFQSFLTGCQTEIVDPDLQLTQFSYRFHSFPQG